MRADLNLIQADFARALLDVDEVDSALATFKGNPDLNRERFALYRGNIIAIWQQTLAGAYPVLRQLTGTDFFADLVRCYATRHPSQSGNLAELGSGLPDFIATLDNCRAYPYLADVAALEWLVHQAYYSAHCNPVTLAELAAVPTEELATIRCRLQPCCALMKSEWECAAIWSAHQSEDVNFPGQPENPVCCLIWRPDWQSSWRVQVSPISEASYVALSALQNGATLGEALELALNADPTFAVQAELADWLHRQLITSITTHGPLP